MALFTKPATIPIIPLPYGTVLFPGVVLRIFISDRHDITSLLNKLTTTSLTTSTPTLDTSTIAIGCVPLRIPASLTSDDHRRRIIHEEADEVEASPGMLNIDPSSATVDDLFTHGTVARIIGLEASTTTASSSLLPLVKSGSAPGPSTTTGMAIVVEGVCRFKISQFRQRTPWYEADVEYFQDTPISGDDTKAVESFLRLKQLSRELIALLRMRGGGVGLPPMVARRLEVMIAKRGQEEAGGLADFMISAVETSLGERLGFLGETEVKGRVEKAVRILERQVGGIREGVNKKRGGMGPHLVVVDPRKAVGPGRRGKGREEEEEEKEADELEELGRRLSECGLTKEAEKVVKRELGRLKRMSPVQAEYGVCRTYLETLAEIPWTKTTNDQLDNTTLARARKQLDEDHYGLEKIKRRLLEYLAVLRLKHQLDVERTAKETAASNAAAVANKPESTSKELIKASNSKPSLTSSPTPKPAPSLPITPVKRRIDKSPILLLVGPPGTGKTSLAKSVATALGRKFHRISLGGVRDEAEIRGHRRTYVAAMPGLIVNALKKVGVANPVILLDEIDKVGGSNFHGDPSAAMLEVLDPEQNWNFVDHYVGVGLDLSQVLFIATANSLGTIPAPLLDRMETIELSGYTSLEKRHIASQYLIPKQLSSNGLEKGQVEISDTALDRIILHYTRESGVRNLEREIGSVCRAKAVEFSEAKDAGKLAEYKSLVDVDDLENILGIEKFDLEIAERSNNPGVVTGLVAFSTGGMGSILFIESEVMPGSGRIQMTGNLKSVIKESVEVALTWVRSHAYLLGLTPTPDVDLLHKKNLHIHLPSGAVPKDGPSAGLAFTIGLISLFSGRRVPPTIAMTGEFSLRGKVTPVGGIREKLIGALAAGVETVIVPQGNRGDVKECPVEVREGLRICEVSGVWEAIRVIWPEWVIGAVEGEEETRIMSRL